MNPQNFDEAAIVGYNKDRNVFVISVPYVLNDLARSFPNRKFSRKVGKWIAPAIRVNVLHIREHSSDGTMVLTESAEEFVRSFSKRSVVPNRIPFPADFVFKTIPRPYQKQVLDDLWGAPMGAIFADMGLGKSKMAIDMAAARFQRGLLNTLLVICPASLRSNWIEQMEDHCPVPWNHFIIDTTQSKFRVKFDKFLDCVDHKLALVAVGVESLSTSKTAIEAVKDVIGYLRCMVVVDESHNIKNPKAKRTETVSSLASVAPYKWIMTGTSISNGIEDLYAQFNFLDENIMGVGSFEAFKARYVIYGGFENRKVVGYRNVPELMDLIRPWVVELRKKDHLKELPDKMYETRNVTLTPEQKKIYRDVKEQGLLDLKAAGSDVSTTFKSILQVSLALQQIAGGFASHTDDDKHRNITEIVPWERNPKVQELLQIIEGSDSRMIIWAKYTEEIKAVMKALTATYGPKCAVPYYGAVNMAERDANKKAFLSGAARFFVGNPLAGGSGLTLNCSDLVVYYSNSFKMVDRLQSEDRNHRIGQKNAVTYVDIPAKGTIDMTILAALRRKEGMLNFVKDSMRKRTMADEMNEAWGDPE